MSSTSVTEMLSSYSGVARPASLGVSEMKTATRRGSELSKDVETRRKGHFSLWKKVDSWTQFYIDRLEEVEEDPSVISSYFKDVDRVMTEIDVFVETTKECISEYRTFKNITGVSQKEISGLVSSLEDLIGVCDEFRWHVGIHVGVQEPWSKDVCENAEEYIRKLRG